MNEDVFKQGVEATEFAENYIEILDKQVLNEVPSNRMAKSRKEILKTELGKITNDNIIEESESLWPVHSSLLPRNMVHQKMHLISKIELRHRA